MTNYNYVISDLPIYKAALLDNWDSVSQLFEQDPELLTKQITYWWETPLIIAVGTNRSHSFVEKLVERIVAVGAKDKLFVGSYGGNNPLHYAAKVGNTTAAKLLVEQNPDMTRVPNPYGNTPLKLAAWHGNKDTLKYLLTVTPDTPLPGEEGSSPYTGVAGGDLITLTIMAGFYDVALEIIESHPNIVLENDRNGKTALQILALKPEIFPSGNRLGFWGNFIYSLMPMKKSEGATGVKVLLKVYNKFATRFWSALGYMAPSIKKIHVTKVNNNLSRLLVDRICKIIIEKVDHNIAWKILGSAITTAVEYGTHELIEECILTYPGIIWYDVGGFYLFLAAIKQRQERVYNLVYQMSGHKVFASTQVDGEENENALHIAAKLAPPHRLNVVTGAALQMQRELQWFQEVQKFIEPSYEEALNKKGKTPRMVFTESHKELLAEGQQWMKDTASSCTVVAALIVTMAFAAAFTVPGGNQDNGKPLFQSKPTFMLFIISDAIALFSSATSVLMFLGILTSRYAEADFLYALPKRLTIGLLSLFMSLAATMIAFSSALALVLEGKVTWIAAPLVIATSIPVCLFGMLQFPLLVELVNSTYGKSIFHQQNARRIH
ncbi:putative ankyrin repeat-containing domain, PGG domain, ankyrin repeat-containing domain superfamily [Helianthus debilis subsp. tardiflorus]